MADVNDVLIMGRLTGDPAYTNKPKTGDLECLFSIISEPWGPAKAKYWIPIKCTKRVAEIVRDHLRLAKGDAIRVNGVLASYKRNPPDGTPRSEHYVRAFRLFLVVKARQGVVRPQPALGPDPDPAFTTPEAD